MKADAASELHANGVLDEDFGPLLRTLNQERKDVWYEGEDPDFGEESLDDVAERVRGLIEAAEADMTESVRLILDRGVPRRTGDWARRLSTDAAIAERYQTPELQQITEVVVSRAIANGAQGVALTGSTARAKRTSISDLDYHVVGNRPDVRDLPADVDVYESQPDKMRAKLLQGDDFVQWTLCCGCLLYDTGVFREAAVTVVEQDLWPDGESKLRRLPELRRLAERLIGVGDRDAAQDQVRAALTSAARGVLLQQGVFALARGELPAQLRLVAADSLADSLDAAIYTESPLEELASMLETVVAFELVSTS